MLSFFRRSSAAWPDVPIDEIRKRARIVVIDDTDFLYLQLFKRDGYTVDKWDDVMELQKLESGYYDIILSYCQKLWIEDMRKAAYPSEC